MSQIFNILSELSFGYISTFEERSLKALVTEAQGISHKLCCTSPFQDWELEVMKSSPFSLPSWFWAIEIPVLSTATVAPV